MSGKKQEKKVEETKGDEVEQALEVLKKAKEQKAKSFLNEYRALCVKYGLELTARASWEISETR